MTSTWLPFATRKFLSALLCITATYCGPQIHAQTFSRAIPGEYIVVLKPTARSEEVAQQHGLAARHQFKHALNGFAGHIPEGRLNALQNDPVLAKFSSCGKFLSAMLGSGTFADNSSCD